MVHYKDELCVILSDLLNWSLQSSHVSNCFKRSIVISVPKRSPVTCNNDYRPVVLTSIVMKCFETIVR